VWLTQKWTPETRVRVWKSLLHLQISFSRAHVLLDRAKVVYLSYGKVGATSVFEYSFIGSIAFRL